MTSARPPHFVSRASFVRIIKPRVEEILEMVRDRLATSPFAAEPRATRGAHGRRRASSPGFAELAARILGRPVRIGRPLGIAGLPEAAKGPAFAVATGLLVYPQAAHLEHFEPRRTRQLDDRERAATSHGSDDGFARAFDDRGHTSSHRPAADRPDPGGDVRNRRGKHDHQPEDPRHSRAEAADHRVRGSAGPAATPSTT